MATKEHYNAKPMGVNASLPCGVSLGGFIPITAGTLTVTDANGTILVNAMPVLADGLFRRIPILSVTTSGMTVTLAGGASGTLLS